MRGPRLFLPVLLALLALVSPSRGRPEEPLRVGVLLWHDSPNDLKALEGVKEGFELTGRRPVYEIARVAEDKAKAHEVLRRWEDSGCDLVYALGTGAALRAKEVTSRIPVVFTAVTNPKGSGVVPDWSGSGSNLCGNSSWIAAPEVLRLFRAAVPNLARLGVILSRDSRVSIEEVAEAKAYFEKNPSQALALHEEYIRGPDDLEDAVTRLLKREIQALWIPIDKGVYDHLDRVAALTVPRGVPLVSSQASAGETHAVVAVAVDHRSLGRNSVVLAEKVLREGVDPGSIEVGRMQSFRVIVNLGAARKVGLKVPLKLLAVADRILDPKRSER